MYESTSAIVKPVLWPIYLPSETLYKSAVFCSSVAQDPCGERKSTHNDLILKIDSAKLSSNRLPSNYILSKYMQLNHIHLCAESLYSNYDSSKNLFKSFVSNLR